MVDARTRQMILRRRSAALASSSARAPAATGAGRGDGGDKKELSPPRKENVFGNASASLASGRRNKLPPARRSEGPASEGKRTLLQRRSLEPLSPLMLSFNPDSPGSNLVIGKTYMKARPSSARKALPSTSYSGMIQNKARAQVVSSARGVPSSSDSVKGRSQGPAETKAAKIAAFKRLHRPVRATTALSPAPSRGGESTRSIPARAVGTQTSPKPQQGQQQDRQHFLKMAASKRQNSSRKLHGVMRATAATLPKQASAAMTADSGIKKKEIHRNTLQRQTTPPKHPTPSTSSLSPPRTDPQQQLAAMMSSSMVMSPGMQKLVSKYVSDDGGGDARGTDEILAQHKRFTKDSPSKADRPAAGRGRGGKVIETTRTRSLSAASSRSLTAAARENRAALLKKSPAKETLSRGRSVNLGGATSNRDDGSVSTTTSPLPPMRDSRFQHAAAHMARRQRSLSAQRAVIESRTPPKKPEKPLPSSPSPSTCQHRPPTSSTARSRALVQMHRRKGRSLSVPRESRNGGNASTASKSPDIKLLQKEAEILSRINLNSGSRSDKTSPTRNLPTKGGRSRFDVERSPPRCKRDNDNLMKHPMHRFRRTLSQRTAMSSSSNQEQDTLQMATSIESESSGGLQSVPSTISSGGLQSVPSGLDSVPSGSGHEQWGNLDVTQSCSFNNLNAAGANGDDESSQHQRYSEMQIIKRKRAREVLARRNNGR